MQGEPGWHHTGSCARALCGLTARYFRNQIRKIQTSLCGLYFLFMENNFLKANQNGPGHSFVFSPSGVSQADVAQPAYAPAAQDPPGRGLMASATFTWSIKQKHIENL